jgi:hypothetical protein
MVLKMFALGRDRNKVSISISVLRAGKEILNSNLKNPKLENGTSLFVLASGKVEVLQTISLAQNLAETISKRLEV